MAPIYQSATRYLQAGYSFRGATLDDAYAVGHLLNLREFKDAGSGHWHTEVIRLEWQTPRFNPAMDVRMVFDPREHLVGYIEVWMAEPHPILWGCVHPEYEGRGIGSALLCWGEARVRLALDSLPASLWAAPRFSTRPVQRAHELCEHLGWQQIRPELAEIKKATGALRLPEDTLVQYDVYEKAVDQFN